MLLDASKHSRIIILTSSQMLPIRGSLLSFGFFPNGSRNSMSSAAIRPTFWIVTSFFVCKERMRSFTKVPGPLGCGSG